MTESIWKVINTIRVEQVDNRMGADVYLTTEDGSYREHYGYFRTHSKAINAARFYDGPELIEYIIYDGRLTEKTC